MTLHLISLPHTRVEEAFCGCAYTAKVLKFCRMMWSQYEIILYAPEGPKMDEATLVPCLSNDERIEIFGKDDPHRLPTWPTDQQTEFFNLRVIQALQTRLKPHDLILLSMGWSHRAIMEAFPSHICCEPGVGYEGIFAKYCAFESYAWMHHVYKRWGINDGRWFDTVIPNYFDPSEFPILNSGKGEYLLFLGRIVERKGPQIASEIAQRCGLPLYVAGAGGKQVGPDIVAPETTVKNANYIGPVTVKERAELLAGARALIAPTTYIEPFGGVAVEAMMAGTPVIATDWGAFTETVECGVSGYRFRSLAEAEWAVGEVDKLRPKDIRAYAKRRYSLAAVAPRYDVWFKRLQSLWGEGWYSKRAA